MRQSSMRILSKVSVSIKLWLATIDWMAMMSLPSRHIQSVLMTTLWGRHSRSNFGKWETQAEIWKELTGVCTANGSDRLSTSRSGPTVLPSNTLQFPAWRSVGPMPAGWTCAAASLQLPVQGEADTLSSQFFKEGKLEAGSKRLCAWIM